LLLKAPDLLGAFFYFVNRLNKSIN
jgi:hypothetical protein